MYPSRASYYYRSDTVAKAKSNRGPGWGAVDKVADELEKTYHRVIERLQNNSPFDEQTKGGVKQLINEFADTKAKLYSDE